MFLTEVDQVSQVLRQVVDLRVRSGAGMVLDRPEKMDGIVAWLHSRVPRVNKSVLEHWASNQDHEYADCHDAAIKL